MSEVRRKTGAQADFTILCIGAFLLSIAYGVTFLIPMLAIQRGGDEALAGVIISAATVSTVLAVIVSGHIADKIGSARTVAASALFLAASGLGFALVPSVGAGLIIAGLILGLGWGTFYTLGPILVAAIVPQKHRTRSFAILSGSMMSGIGAGPLIGRTVSAFSLPIEAAFLTASMASIAGGALCALLHIRLTRASSEGEQLKSLSFQSAGRVLGSRAAYSILMVAIGGAIFGGLSSFQTSYANAHGFDYSLFFVGFMSAAIGGRLFLARFVVQLDPLFSLISLTGLTMASIVVFINMPSSPLIYLGAAALLGIGYGLTYSVINGLAANEAPEGLMPQSLLMFALAYFIGVFGFPLIAGRLIVSSGFHTVLGVLLALSILNCCIAVFRTVQRARTRPIPRKSAPIDP